MNNHQILKVNTFRNIFLEPLMANNKLDERENVEKIVLKEIPLAIKYNFSLKKKNKS